MRSTMEPHGPTPAPSRLVARVVADDPQQGTTDAAASAVTTRRSRSGAGMVTQIGRVGSSLLMAGLVVFLGVFGGASDRPAQAGLMDDLCWAITPPYVGAGPDMYGGGVDGLFPGWTPLAQGWEAFVQWQNGQNQTYEGNGNYYEQFGMAGTNWIVFTGGDELYWDETDRIWRDDEIEDNNCFPVMTFAANMASQTVFDVSKAITRTTISGVQLALSDDVFDSFWPIIDEVVNNLRDWLYLGFIEPLVMLAAVWMAWNGLVKRRTTQTMQGMVWMLVAVSASLAFMANPSGIARGLNNVLGTLTQTVTNATLTLNFEEPLEGEGSINDSYVCATTDGAQRTQRMMGCGIWKAMVFTPWSVGQFGTADPSGLAYPDGVEGMQTFRPGGHELNYHGDVRLAQLDAQTYTHDDGANGVTNAMVDAKRNALVSITYDANMFMNPQWVGDNPGSRFTIAVSSLLAAIIGGALLSILAITLLTIHMFMLTLTVTAPLFLLAGVHPGMGRRIALRWFELWLGTFIKRLIVTFLIALLVGFYQMIFSMPVSWGTQLLMVLAVSIATFLYRKPVVEMFSNVNMGGMRLEGIEDRHVSKKGVAMATGATVAGVAAGRAMAGSGATKTAMAKSMMKAGAKGAVRTAHTPHASRAAYSGGRVGERQGRQDLKRAGLKKGTGKNTPSTSATHTTAPTGPKGKPGPDLGVYRTTGPDGQSDAFQYKDQVYDTPEDALAAKEADRARAETAHKQVQHLRSQDGQERFQFAGRKYATRDEAEAARAKAVAKTMAAGAPTGSVPKGGNLGENLQITRVKSKIAGGSDLYQYRGQTYGTADEARAARRLDTERLKSIDRVVPPVVRSRGVDDGKEQFQFDGAVYATEDDAEAARDAVAYSYLSRSTPDPDLKIRPVPQPKDGDQKVPWEATYKGKGYATMDEAILARRADEKRAKAAVPNVQRFTDKTTGQEAYAFSGRRYTTVEEATQARAAELKKVMAQPSPRATQPPRGTHDTRVVPQPPSFPGDVQMFSYRGELYGSEAEAHQARDRDTAKAKEYAPRVVHGQGVIDGVDSYQVDGYAYPTQRAAATASEVAGWDRVTAQPPAPPRRPDLRIREVAPDGGGASTVSYKGKQYASKSQAMQAKMADLSRAQSTVPKIQRVKLRAGREQIRFAGRQYDSLQAAQAARKDALKRVMSYDQQTAPTGGA